MSTAFNSDFGREFARSTPEQQSQVVEFVRQLNSEKSREERRQAILKLAGSIPPDDIELMKAAIEAGCERVAAVNSPATMNS